VQSVAMVTVMRLKLIEYTLAPMPTSLNQMNLRLTSIPRQSPEIAM